MIKLLIDDGMQMRVGTGIGKYTENLYNGLKNDGSFTVELNSPEFSGGRKLKRLKYIYHINSNGYLQKLKNFDVVHYTNYLMPFRKVPHAKTIVTIHDLTAFLYPETLPKAYRSYNRWAVNVALKNADAIITVSNSVKNEIIHQFPTYDSNKIHVIYPGLYTHIHKLDQNGSINFESILLQKLKPDNRFFLFVGTIEKRKNLAIVIRAFFKFKQTVDQGNRYKLILAGRPGYGYEDYKEIIDNSPYKDDVIVTGYISDADCDALYNKAEAYIFPTVYEGFGSPTVECMACDLPIILSDIQVNREIAGKYGTYFSLDNMDTLVNAMTSLYKSCLPIKGEKYLKKYMNDVVLKQYRNLIEQLLIDK